VLKLAVYADGRLNVDGKASSVEQLRDSLHALAASHGIVWYYREAAQHEPPPIVRDVLKEIVAARVPVRLSSKPDYSDTVVP
jgi:hypothetical protein